MTAKTFAMTPLDLTIDQFQRIVAVQQVPGISDADVKVNVVAIALDKTPDEVKKMKLREVAAIYKAMTDFAFEQLPYKETIRIGRHYYRMTLFADQLKAGQLLELFEYDMTNEAQVVQNMHKILATLSRRCRVWKLLPEAYDGTAHAKRAEAMLQMTLRDAWGIVGFFLSLSEPLLMALATYSNKTTKTMGKASSR